jgi:hypothetical protein
MCSALYVTSDILALVLMDRMRSLCSGHTQIGSNIEYWFDKTRLLRIAGKPKRTNNTYKNVLMFFYFMMACGVLVGCVPPSVYPSPSFTSKARD